MPTLAGVVNPLSGEDIVQVIGAAAHADDLDDTSPLVNRKGFASAIQAGKGQVVLGRAERMLKRPLGQTARGAIEPDEPHRANAFPLVVAANAFAAPGPVRFSFGLRCCEVYHLVAHGSGSGSGSLARRRRLFCLICVCTSTAVNVGVDLAGLLFCTAALPFFVTAFLTPLGLVQAVQAATRMVEIHTSAVPLA